MNRDYRSLVAWQWADAFACEIYLMTRTFPPEELYGGLGSQLRSAAAGAAAYIVEGVAQPTARACIEFLQEARAALAVADYYLLLAQYLGYIDQKSFMHLAELREDVTGVLSRFIESLEPPGAGEQARPRAAGQVAEAA